MTVSTALRRRMARLAERQHGLVTRQQLLDLGFSGSAIDRRLGGSELHRVHRGVYALGHRALPPLAQEHAALLLYGAGAHISHASAAAIWTDGKWPAPDIVDVVLIEPCGHARSTVRVHRSGRLDAADLRSFDGLSLTAPARTVIDLAADGFDRLDALLSDMLAMRLLITRDLNSALERAPRRRGLGLIRDLIDANRVGFTRSEAERRLRKLCRDAGLPQPTSNTRVCGYEVDFVWLSARLVVEVDGYRYHAHRAAFERDRQRDARLVANGFRVVRVTWLQLTKAPMAVAATIAAALAQASRPT